MAGHAHAHQPARADNQRNVFWAMVLTGSFMLAEVVGGVVAGSLALIADAGHMLTDAASLGLAWAAFRVGHWPRDARRTYGYHRFQVLAAFVNALALVAIVGWIAIEAIRRLFAPVEILGGLMLAIAALGLLVNLAAFAILRGGDRDNLNLQGAALHVLGDLLGSVAAIVAALVILWTGWTPIDPLLSLFVALLILRSAWLLLRRSAHILLEGTPDWLEIEELRAAVTSATPAIRDIHHVHAWMLTTERSLITLHAEVAPGADHQAVLAVIREVLRERFGITHATIQIETAGCTDSRAWRGVPTRSD
ncbi:MAG TPA: cation diffusion facilitator family transporter [Geminicoccaceae bacterium]|jgi:cobalt-zinc-cadmium efflux system protein|nr:cation diffusion facilitator family transporter [Geminicoccaceae bacterium]